MQALRPLKTQHIQALRLLNGQHTKFNLTLPFILSHIHVVQDGINLHLCFVGLYPLVGWKIGSEVVYVAEGVATGTATSIEWAKQMGKSGFLHPQEPKSNILSLPKKLPLGTISFRTCFGS